MSGADVRVPHHTPLGVRIEAWTDRSTSCWRWVGHVNKTGYALMGVDGKTRQVHRVSYEYFVGPIPDGLQLDHLCRVTDCVNPDHLEPVTPTENMARGEYAQKTHCPSGHLYDEANTLMHRGHRYCRPCNRNPEQSPTRRLHTAARLWAQAAGVPVGVRGPVHADVMAAYLAAKDVAA